MVYFTVAGEYGTQACLINFIILKCHSRSCIPIKRSKKSEYVKQNVSFAVLQVVNNNEYEEKPSDLSVGRRPEPKSEGFPLY